MKRSRPCNFATHPLSSFGPGELGKHHIEARTDLFIDPNHYLGLNGPQHGIEPSYMKRSARVARARTKIDHDAIRRSRGLRNVGAPG